MAYVCPECDYEQETPGDCPDCAVALVEEKVETSPEETGSSESFDDNLDDDEGEDW